MRLLTNVLLFLIVFPVYALDVKTYIPKQAPVYIPFLKLEVNKYTPDINPKEYFPGLVEQESCISLTHSRCWNPSSRLQSKRELGIGFGQVTKAFNEDGSIRFDSLEDMRRRHHNELKQLSWNTIEYRPDLQLRTMVLMTKDNYSRLYQVKDNIERLKMTDAAYNGGLGGFFKDQRLCGLTKGCDIKQWDNNIELTCSKSKKPLYGNRNACDINREHVRNIFDVRMYKYKLYME